MKDKINNLRSNLEKEEITINLYTLNRKYQVKSLEKKYVVNFATIKGDSKDYILETIKNFLKNSSLFLASLSSG